MKNDNTRRKRYSMKTETQLITFRIRKKAWENFKSKYPNIQSKFLKNCMYKALDDYEFVTDILFKVITPEKNGHGGK